MLGPLVPTDTSITALYIIIGFEAAVAASIVAAVLYGAWRLITRRHSHE